MAFVNEYISDEDMEKYKIIDVYRMFDPRWNHVNEGLMKGRYSWTIDKERNIFLILIGGGRYEESNQQFFVLWWAGVLITVRLASVGGNVNYIDRTGSGVWDLLSIGKPDEFKLSNEEIFPILKAALVIYQDSGILTPMKEYQVTFAF